ncbi:hypothetical protein CYMTET_21501 [Cymbomonas tetramitiformis]|uniref:Uncharacterized protein n=1 Tax=Cymbomonas tetramitiformis TaxID=36881 RepID=A0AAE0G295_9CHLO|nr:hypothetical protein CYMTET_21501 [Cymbomonas tetramitiformis]
MNRECPDKFLVIPHIKAPLCFLHAGMRVTEWLLLKIQERAIQHKKVSQLNRAWKESGGQYQMNQDKSGTNTYYSPSLDGRKTKAVIHSSSDWVHVIDDRGPVADLWQQWELIFEVGRKMEPTSQEKKDFGPRCRQFFRCCKMLYTDEGLAWYIHHLAAHGGEYMLRRPLGKDMNEALEAHHLTSWQMAGHVFQGRRPGNPFCVKCEDGSFIKTEEPAYEHNTLTVTESVMQTQLRLFLDKHKEDWDPSVWTSQGLHTLDSSRTFLNQYREHAPVSELTVQRQGLRRRAQVAKKEADNLKIMRSTAQTEAEKARVERQERLVQRRKDSVAAQKKIVNGLQAKAVVASALKRARQCSKE